MAISKQGVILPLVNILGVRILTTFCYFGVSFDPDVLESQSRALKTREIA